MRSSALLERHSALPESGVRDLLVLWQRPDTREIVPLGRLGRTSDDQYSFVYARATAEIPQLRPLPGLPNLEGRHVGPDIPAVFGQRVMRRRRPDFADYARSLGLEPDQATPWEQIVHSGGRRAGDTLQFMPMPTVQDGRAMARFLVNGVRHIPNARLTVAGRRIAVTREQQEWALRSLRPHGFVLVEPESGNPRDDEACLVTVGGVPVGWAPRVLSRDLRDLMTNGSLRARVHRVGEPGTTPHIRLTLDVDVSAPGGFRFDREGRWEPRTPT